jgi:integrase
MRNRKQNGYLYKRAGIWVLRYRETVSEAGELREVQRAKQIAPISQYKNKPLLERDSQELRDARRTINDRCYAAETVTTLGEFAEKVYLPHADNQKRASTAHGYRNKWQNYLADRCPKLWMRDVRTCDIQELLDEIAQAHDLSRTSLRHVKALLSAIFNHAKQQGHFDAANPVVGTAIPKARSASETYAYSVEGVLWMIARLPEPAGTIVATAAFSGLRRSEIKGLTWDNYTGAELSVKRSMWNSIADEPKTRRSKAPVPVVARLKTLMDAHQFASESPKDGPIFRNDLGKPMCLNNIANRVIIPKLHPCKVCRKGRIDHKNTTHDFQLEKVVWHGWHAFRGLGTNLYRLGVSDKVIQAILRHANLNTTMNVYVKSVAEDSVKAMQLLDTRLCAESALISASTRGSGDN